VPKGKKVKVLTHRPRYIEPAVVPEFGVGTSSATEIKEIVPTTQSIEEPVVMPKVLTESCLEGGWIGETCKLKLYPPTRSLD
jgi:hypothetical protein